MVASLQSNPISSVAKASPHVKGIKGRIQGLQIRIGPARGVVVVDTSLVGRKLVLTKGMVKWF